MPSTPCPAPHRTRRLLPAAAGPAGAGFTLLELIIVIAIIGILAAIVLPQLKDKPLRAKEAVLKTDLFTMRDTIDQYYADKGKYPPSLEALVSSGYLRKVPADPITGRTDTWILTYEKQEEGADEPLPVDDGEESGPGITDVHSGAPGNSILGSPYSEW